MSATLPDGAVLALATTIASTTPMTTVSNANPAVVGSTAHGYNDGDYLLLLSGWGRLNNRVVRVANKTTDTYELEDIDTSNTTFYPAGSGTGTAAKITAWTQISQILGFTTTGGDQQFTNFSFLENDFEQQLPTVTSAQSLQLEIADDPSLAGYIAVKAASDSRDNTPLRMTLPNTSVILYNGVWSLNETPTVNKGNVMSVRANVSLQARPTRYAA